ncbi:MAG: winged helix-turn-helix domain-containing protein [Prevotellaceae bacterium]|nr:winged helix-turn-helix domain-containing protein [Prevotellaceae bacterium]
MKENIGKNAGLIWQALKSGEKEVKALKRNTKLKERDLNLALGWLARESKINFREDAVGSYVSLA